ncbi:MAG: hypothetical protein O2955_13885 [Planctomycetota bacterium]|nr:hypothetical protein [Planctomycetota bacterium]MDA1213601.1 hypothetical protein [Planctomycetota bacterium]
MFPLCIKFQLFVSSLIVLCTMIRRILNAVIDSQERKLGQSLDYLRYMLQHSFGGFRQFTKIVPMSTYRKTLPLDACYVARLVSTMQEDCGACVQIGIDMAQKEGVPTELVQSIIDDDVARLSPELQDVANFSRHVARAEEPGDELRERLRNRYGDAGLVELSLAIATSRVYPTVKRALGYAKTCAIFKPQVTR